MYVLLKNGVSHIVYTHYIRQGFIHRGEGGGGQLELEYVS